MDIRIKKERSDVEKGENWNMNKSSKKKGKQKQD